MIWVLPLLGSVHFRLFPTILDFGGRSSKTPENEYGRSDNCDRHARNPNTTTLSCHGWPLWSAEVIGELAAVPKAAAIEVTSQFI